MLSAMRCSPTKLLVGIAACVGAGAVPAIAAPDTSPPVVTHVRVTHSRFRVGTRPMAQFAAQHAGRSKAPIGTTFELSVNERSTVVVGIAGRIAGRKPDKNCLENALAGRPCPAFVATGFARSGQGPGKVSIAFSGRIGTTPLPPGTYVAAVGASDASGLSSDPKIVHFKIVK